MRWVEWTTGPCHRLRRRMAGQGVTDDADGVSLDESQAVAVGRSVLIGAGVSAGLLVAANAGRLFAHGWVRWLLG